MRARGCHHYRTLKPFETVTVIKGFTNTIVDDPSNPQNDNMVLNYLKRKPVNIVHVK